MIRPHILILGAGFGGMYTARALRSLVKSGAADVTIINDTNYFLFTPLLHEVATGSLAPQSVTEPLREIFAGTKIKIYQGKVTSINRQRRTVTVAGDASEEKLFSYDLVVVATGATTAYYGIPGAAEHTFPLKTLSDAIDIRHRIIQSFEKAILCDDPIVRARLLSFAVVGGGPTGVEIVSELAEFIKGMVKRYYHSTDCQPDEAGSCQPEEPTVSLVHAGKELLQQFSPRLRAAATDRLKKDGIRLFINTQVTQVTPDGLTFSNKTTLPAATVIWAAGVTPIIPPFDGEKPILTGNRLAIDEHFHLMGNDKIFVLGDVAGYVNTMKPFAPVAAAPVPVTPTTLPMLAQVAIAQARTVAFNIKAAIAGKKLNSFSYRSKGSMVSIGQWFAMGEIFSFKISGPITWWIWRTVYLFKFISWKKRLRIVIDWSLNVFYPRDITTK